MARSLGADNGLHVKRPNDITGFCGAQPVRCYDQGSHALFKPRIAFQLTLLQLLHPFHLGLQHRDL